MKTVLLGARGQLGRDLEPLLGGEVLSPGRNEIDLDRSETIRPYLDAVRPGRVVNCAAYNFVDKAETEPLAAFQVNGWAVRELALACRDLDAEFVTFSTDYVYGLDGSRSSPWAEHEAAGPLGVYGTSKLAGEAFAQAYCPRHYVIRTCGLYGLWGSGGKGGNFVETMIRVASSGKPLRVVADQHCTPTFTLDLARATAALLGTGRYGLYHATNGGATTWHDLAAEIFRVADMKADLTPIPSTDFAAQAKRPPYSVLGMDKLAAAGVAPLRPWQEALADYLSRRAKHRQTLIA